MGKLAGKVALITGGTRGIGKGLVERMYNEGARVVFSYVSSQEKADALVAHLGGEDIIGVRSDASQMDDAKALVQATLDSFGTIDIVVNNAGITKDNLLIRMSEDDWRKVIDVNLSSVFNVTKCAIQPMLRKRAGSIINMTSVVGVFGNAGQSNYAASKAGIIGFTKSIAKELGSRKIRCNAIAPGFIQTEMTDQLDEKVIDSYKANIPLKALGTVNDIAEATLFLASDASRYITGQVFSICGGLNI